ncbi:hypothetical protein P0E95_002457 [Vibrio metschnikovii]|nr:hypothetical protein [Vibrio metschnikovii]EKO3770708.1 hypothetical protein [Vibrio metschnikovii]
MLPFLQKHFCVWPSDQLHEAQARKNKRFDRVVGLIPQSDCLFKTFHYQSNIVAKDEVAICIENELNDQVVWEQFEFYTLIHLVDDYWCASVWVWEKGRHIFERELTHVIPALAYSIGRVVEKKCTIYYQEGNLEWIVFIEQGIIKKLLTLSPRLKDSILSQAASYDARTYTDTAGQYHGLVCLEYPKSLPNLETLNNGKLAIYQDISNPKTFFKPVMLLIMFCLALMAVDYTVISLRDSQTDSALKNITRDTQDLMVSRSLNNDMLNHIKAIDSLKLQQKRLALIMDAMLKELPKDIVFEQITYKENTILVTGSFQTSVQLLESLTMLPWVKNVKAIGDILPNQSGSRQVFRIEIELGNYES